MNTPNPSEINPQQPAVPVLKKEAQSGTSSTSAERGRAHAVVDAQSYAVSLAANVSSTLVAFGIASDLYNKGQFFGLKVGAQKAMQIRAADHASSNELNTHLVHAIKDISHVSVIAPLTQIPHNYQSTDGRAHIRSPKALECQILMVPVANRKAVWSEADLGSLKRAATVKNGLSIIMFQGLNNDEEALLSAFFKEVFIVSQCEPDEGYASAYMVAPMRGSLRAAMGYQTIMENIRPYSEGRIERDCQPCVSPDRLTREIYRLRKEEKKSLEEIGKALGYNKSTISRRLSALPFHLRGDRF